MVGVQLELIMDFTNPDNPVFVNEYTRVPGVGFVFNAMGTFDDVEDVTSNLLTGLNGSYPENDSST